VVVYKRLFNMEICEEKEFIVENPLTTVFELNANTKMEVGIENFIQLEYELFKSKFSLNDCVLGKVYFVKIKFPVKTMEIHIYRKESLGQGVKNMTENELIGKYEILDGSPYEKDIIPIRMYLDCYELTPTWKSSDDLTLSVSYFLKFVVVDCSDKIYFKQQELFLYRDS